MSNDNNVRINLLVNEVYVELNIPVYDNDLKQSLDFSSKVGYEVWQAITRLQQGASSVTTLDKIIDESKLQETHAEFMKKQTSGSLPNELSTEAKVNRCIDTFITQYVNKPAFLLLSHTTYEKLSEKYRLVEFRGIPVLCVPSQQEPVKAIASAPDAWAGRQEVFYP